MALGSITPPNRHDSPLLSETLDTVKILWSLPELANVYLEPAFST